MQMNKEINSDVYKELHFTQHAVALIIANATWMATVSHCGVRNEIHTFIPF